MVKERMDVLELLRSAAGQYAAPVSWVLEQEQEHDVAS